MRKRKSKDWNSPYQIKFLEIFLLKFDENRVRIGGGLGLLGGCDESTAVEVGVGANV